MTNNEKLEYLDELLGNLNGENPTFGYYDGEELEEINKKMATALKWAIKKIQNEKRDDNG
jgi:hypothetical protein